MSKHKIKPMTLVVILAAIIILAFILLGSSLTGYATKPPPSINPPVQYNCTDSDGGADLETQGTCEDVYGTVITDYCDAISLKEAGCVNNSFCDYATYDCMLYGYDGCGSGVCNYAGQPIPPPNETIFDSIYVYHNVQADSLIANNLMIMGGSPEEGKVLTATGTGGVAIWQTPTNGGIIGNGTTDYIVKWTGSNSLGNSIASEDPEGKFQVDGKLISDLSRFTPGTSGSRDGLYIQASDPNNAAIVVNRPNLWIWSDDFGDYANLYVRTLYGTTVETGKLCIAGDCKTSWPSASNVTDVWVNTVGDAMTGRLDIATTNGYELQFTGANGANIYSPSSDMYFLAGPSKRIVFGTNGIDGKVAIETDGTLSAMTAVKTSQVSMTGTTLYPGQLNALRIQTPSGYVDVGPMTTGWSHFDTDREKFYFSKPVYVNGELAPYTSGKYLGTPSNLWSNIFAGKLWLDTGIIEGAAPTITYNGKKIGNEYSGGKATCSSTGTTTMNGNIAILSCSGNSMRVKCGEGGLVSGGCDCGSIAVIKDSASEFASGWYSTPVFAEWQCYCANSTAKSMHIQCVR